MKFAARLGRAALVVLALALLPSATALAQGTIVYQSGLATPGDLSKFLTQGRIGDVGGLTGDAAGNGVNPFAIDDGAGAGLALLSANTDSGYRSLTLGHDPVTGAALIDAESVGMSASGLEVRLNGITYPFPGTGTGCVNGPSSTTAGDIAVFNSGTGCLLADGGVVLAQLRLPVLSGITYYVNPSGSSSPCGGGTCGPGSDSNPGTQAAPFATINHAIALVSDTLDFRNYAPAPVVQLANGTYNQQALILPFFGVYTYGSSQPVLQGNNASPASVIINGNGAQPVYVQPSTTPWLVTGVTLAPSNTAEDCFFTDAQAFVDIGTVSFKTCGAGVNARYGSFVEILSGSTLSFTGTFNTLLGSDSGSFILGQGDPGAETVNLVGTPTCTSACFQVDPNSNVDIRSFVFTGSATGPRFFSSGLFQATGTVPGSTPAQYGTREEIPATTWYVSVAGSNNNDCLTALTACATVSHVASYIQTNFDTASNVTVQLADSLLYSEAIGIVGPLVGGGSLIIQGDAGTPSNVLFSSTGLPVVTALDGANVTVADFKATASGSDVLYAAGPGAILTAGGGMIYGAGAAALHADFAAQIKIAGNFTVVGNEYEIFDATGGGQIFNGTASTVTLSGSPVMANASATASTGGIIALPSNTYSGSLGSGEQYQVQTGGNIQVGGATLPGTGSASTTGGIYNSTFNAGVVCSGSPTSSFATVNGVVTHC